MATTYSEQATAEIETRVLRLLAAHTLLSEHELRVRAAPGCDSRMFRRLLTGLLERELVVRKAERRAFWYVGYALRTTAPDEGDVELPASFARVLLQLAERHPDWDQW